MGPVPTTAPALPCPPRPAPSQRGTSRQGDAPQAQPALSMEAASLGMPAASLGTQDAPHPWKHQHKCSPTRAAACEHEHTHPTENSRVIEQNRDPHDCLHSEVISPHVGTQNADTTCSQTPLEAENTSPGDGHTGRRTASMWETHPVDTQTCSEYPRRTR